MDNEIRQRLLHYLAGQISAEDLETWLIAESWDLDDDAGAMANEAILALTERGLGHLSAGDLNDTLTQLASTSHFGPRPHTMTASASSTRQVTLAQTQVVAADRRSEEAFA